MGPVTSTRIVLENFLFPTTNQSTSQILLKATIVVPILAFLAYTFVRGLEYLGLGNRNIKQITPDTKPEVQQSDNIAKNTLNQPQKMNPPSPLATPLTTSLDPKNNPTRKVNLQTPTSITGSKPSDSPAAPNPTLTPTFTPTSTSPPSNTLTPTTSLQPAEPIKVQPIEASAFTLNNIVFTKIAEDTYRGNNGDIYNGKIQDGKLHDEKGIYTFHQGWKLTGKFKNNKLFSNSSNQVQIERDGNNARYPAMGSPLNFGESDAFSSVITELEKRLPTSTSTSSTPKIKEDAAVQGTHTFKNGLVFTGSLLNDKPHGEGVVKYPNGIEIHCTLKGERMGHLCKVLFPNGNNFLGDVYFDNEDERFTLGDGTMTYANGDIYKGVFSSGPMGEQVPEAMNNYSYFSKNFLIEKKSNHTINCTYGCIKWDENVNDSIKSLLATPEKLHGYLLDQYNKQVKHSGDVFTFDFGDTHFTWEGTFDSDHHLKQGKLTKKISQIEGLVPEVYTGSFKPGFIRDRGKQVFDDGAVYEGSFKNNKMDTTESQEMATYTLPDGYVYKGSFEDGKWKSGSIQRVSDGQSIQIKSDNSTFRKGNITELNSGANFGQELRHQFSNEKKLMQ